MNEADFRRRWQARFEKDGRGKLWRIPDAPPIVGPDGAFRSSGLRPFDLFGVTSDGRGIAVEVKYQRAGLTFNMASHVRPHQLIELKCWARLNGIALLVIGWTPIGWAHAEIIEIAAETLAGDEKLDLAKLTGRSR